jgi:hypothetical protein
VKETGLPAGWILEKGMIAMDEVKDEWKLEGNYITRKHYLPRNSDYKPEEDTCPLPLHYLMKDRYTKMGTQLVRDKWSRPSKNKKLCSGWWTGYTDLHILEKRCQTHLHGKERGQGDRVLQRDQAQ